MKKLIRDFLITAITNWRREADKRGFKIVEENRFLLTMMVAERTKQLLAGAKPLVKIKSKNRVDIALQEIRAGKVYLKEKKVPKEEDLFKRVFRFRPEEEDQELESRRSGLLSH